MSDTDLYSFLAITISALSIVISTATVMLSLKMNKMRRNRDKV